jgi:hypothetical protein
MPNQRDAEMPNQRVAEQLGQASDFDPRGAGLAVAAGLHLLGWLLAITVIAAITRSFSKS